MDPLSHPNYCPLLYKSLHVTEDPTHLSASHCCISPMSIKTTQPDFYNDKFLVDSRNNWLHEKIITCRACWDAEDKDYPSHRQHNIDWIKDINANPTTVELLRLDYSVGKLCNAKCIICGSHSSTTWIAEDYKFFKTKQPVTLFDNPSQTLVKHLDLSKLQQLYFIGGEPMMSIIPQAILKSVEEQGNISNLICQLSTNGSIRPSDELVESWAKCRKIDVFASIDAIGSAFEYIRNPLNWNEVESNLDYMLDLSSNIHISISLTLGLHNIDELEKTYLWYKSKSWDLTRTQFTIAPCHGVYSFSSATDNLLKFWTDKISKMSYPWVEQVLGLLSIPGNSNNNQWIRHLEHMDLRRGLVWQKHLPNLYSTYCQIEQNTLDKIIGDNI